MSHLPGSSVQPEFDTTCSTSMVAPQAGQFNCVPSEARPHQGHVCVRVGWFGAVPPKVMTEASSVCVVVDVHGLDADSTGAGHAREVHARPAEEAGRQLLRLDVHRHGGVLVEERARLDHDALARLQDPLENVAVAVKQKESGLCARDEAIHEHALAAEEDVAQALNADVRIRDVVRGEEEGVLAHVQLHAWVQRDRKSTRLNSSHANISYA